MDSEIEDTIFVETSDITFEVATAGDPQSDRLALMLHGFPELNYSWRYQMPLLADLGYRDAEAREDELAAFFGDEPMA